MVATRVTKEELGRDRDRESDNDREPTRERDMHPT